MQLERTDPVNWSTLKSILVSPRHYLHRLATPPEQTPAMLLGSLVHCLALEAGAFESRYVVSPRFNRAMNDDTALARGYEGGKQAAAAWDARCGSRTVITTDMLDAATSAIRSVGAACALPLGGKVETALRWTDGPTGIACRGTPDLVADGRIYDLKTCRSVASVERDAFRLGYHAQLAYYHDGAECFEPPVMVCVETVAPYDVLVLEFDERAVAAGRALYRRALETLHACRTSGEWPGVGRRTIHTPAWAQASEDLVLTIGGEEVAV
jgi:exodeoxyribonuclease VIII